MTMLSPIIQKAAKQLGLDQVEVLKVNAPEGQAKFGAPGGGRRAGARVERLRARGHRQGRRALRLA